MASMAVSMTMSMTAAEMAVPGFGVGVAFAVVALRARGARCMGVPGHAPHCTQLQRRTQPVGAC